MYFGSVKFFKHLILTVIALLIVLPVTICIILAVDLNDKNQQIVNLKEQLDQTSSSGHQMQNANDTSADESEAVVTTETSIETTNSPETSPPETTAETTTANTDNPNSGNLSFDKYPELVADTTNITYDDDNNYVYLTFDDGPSIYTVSFLNYLKENNVKATFFVVPDESPECAERLKMIANAGHTIGIHCYSHVYEEIYASVDTYLDDFKKAYDIVYNATGVKCELFRFPGGSINDYNAATRSDIIAEMTKRGFIYYDWNVDSNDWRDYNWTQLYQGILNDVAENDRSIVLMHDTDDRYNTLLVIEDIIKALTSEGYKLQKLTASVKPIQF